MPTRIKTAESHVKLAAPELPAGIRSGGENLPLDYPHLYQIQAGDWRISYAVEHNRLAILVLEVLNPAGESSKDAAQEDLTHKMKIKLLDWPEGEGNRQLPPEVVTNKMKIKWLDMAEDGDDGTAENVRGKSRIKLKGASQKKAQAPRGGGSSRITLLESGEIAPEDEIEADDSEHDAIDDQDRKITPLDEPSM
jgi:hypothetical protein